MAYENITWFMGLLYFIYSFLMLWQKGCTLVSQLRGSLSYITWAYLKPCDNEARSSPPNKCFKGISNPLAKQL
jgi:hypothetical protein